jgi:hypothetical protein
LRISTLTVVAALALAPVAGIHAQSAALPVPPGTRVRVHAENLVTPLVAHFLEMRGDTAVFIEDQAGRGVWSLTLDQITKLERSAGDQRSNRNYIMRGAFIGAPVGAIAGFIFSASVHPSDTTEKYNRAPTALLGAVVGAGVGALIGTRFATEHWSNVALPRRVSVMPLSRGGVQLGLGFVF